MSTSIRSFALATCVGSAAIAASAGSVSAALIDYSYGISESSSRRFLQGTQYVTGSVSHPYTAGGSPSVTEDNGVITFDFNGLSTSFNSSARGTVYEMTTTGTLVITLHFDEPTSIIALLNEGGGVALGNGTVNASGSMTIVGLDSSVAQETQSDTFDATFGGGGWNAEATTLPFVGYYTDYEITISNTLFAAAPNGYTLISKTSLLLQIFASASDRPPIPEPASLSLLGLGAVGLLARRRK